MVRTAAGGIRISAGKSSKKVGGSAPSASAGSSIKTSSSSSSKLPPIPHQETPSWQKPITNFFKKSPLKSKENKSDSEERKDISENHNAEPSRKKLRLDSEDDRDEETNLVIQENEEKQRGNTTLKDNKENAVKKVQEFDEGAGSSKD